MISTETENTGSKKGTTQRGAFAMFALFSRSLQQISALVMTLLAARFLLPAEYGVYSLAIVFVTLIQTMTYTGFYHFIVTTKGDDNAILSTSFWMLAGLATGASLLLAALAGPIAGVFNAPDLAPVLFWFAVLQPLAGITAWYSAAVLRRQDVTKHFAIMFVQNLVALVLGVILLLQWQSLFALVAYRAVRIVSGILLYLGLSQDHPRLHFDRLLSRQAMRFSGGLYGSRFMNFLQRYAGDLILGFMFTTAEAGLYRFGNRVAGGATDVVAQPMASFSLTQFGAANRHDQPIDRPLEQFAGTLVLLTGIIAAVIIVLGEAVLGAFFNPAYLAALGVTYAMAVRSVMNVGLVLMTPAMSARSKTGVLMFFNMATAVGIILSVLVSAPLGLTVLAWSQAVATLLATLAAFAVMDRTAGISVQGALRALAVAMGVVVAYGIVLWLIWNLAISPAGLHAGWSILSGVIVAVVLTGPTLVIARKFRVFTLSVFSG